MGDVLLRRGLLDRSDSGTEATLLGTILLETTPSAASEFDLFANVLASRGVVLGVLVVLVIMSAACVTIITYKAIWFMRLKRASRVFVDTYWATESPNELYTEAKERPSSPEARIFVAGYRELAHLKNRKTESGALAGGFENVERVVRRQQTQELRRFERLLPFLATTGSTAPFIGLFGTVWGIMRAFAGLGQRLDEQQNLLMTVTPHIAEALVATAIGLFAAIPAVMAYNWFVQRVRRAATDVEGFSVDYMNTLRRLYFK